MKWTLNLRSMLLRSLELVGRSEMLKWGYDK